MILQQTIWGKYYIRIQERFCDSRVIDTTFDQTKKIITKDLDNWNSNFWRLRCREQVNQLTLFAPRGQILHTLYYWHPNFFNFRHHLCLMIHKWKEKLRFFASDPKWKYIPADIMQPLQVNNIQKMSFLFALLAKFIRFYVWTSQQMHSAY